MWQAAKRAKRAQQAKSELQQMNLMHSWLTSKPTLQPSTRLHLKDMDQNSLKRLFRQLSRALQPWKELYISSACAQATFVLTAQVCTLTCHITTMLPWGDANLACVLTWVWTMCCCHLAACKAVVQRSASMQGAKQFQIELLCM